MPNRATRPDRSPLLWAAFFLLVGVGITGLLLADAFATFDQNVYAALAAVQSDGLTSFLAGLTNLGGAIGLIPIGVGVILLLFWRNLRLEAVFLLVALLGAEIFNELAKAVFDRSRPVGINLIALPDSTAFPSGHAMVSSAFYVMMAYQIKTRLRGSYSRWIMACLYLLVVLISISRVYLGVHYASDVLAGAVFGLSWYFVIRYFYEQAVKRWKTPNVQLASIKLR